MISPISSDKSMAGASSDQKLAAVMTPAANPNMPSRYFFSTVLKKKTIAAPRAVTDQVKRVAKSAWVTGLKPESHSNILILHNIIPIQ